MAYISSLQPGADLDKKKTIIGVVSTLNRGTRYYQYEGVVSMQLSLVAWRIVPAPPRGRLQGHHVTKKDNILHSVNSGSGPLDTQPEPPARDQDLREVQTGPLRRVPDLPVWGPGRSQGGPGILREGVPGP
jgi:hypothetical protein